jgi:hypothetical protein
MTDKISRFANLSPNQRQGILDLMVAPTAPGAEDHKAMNNRNIALEWLHRLDGRGEPSHPLRSTYTGLWQEFNDALKASKTPPKDPKTT